MRLIVLTVALMLQACGTVPIHINPPPPVPTYPCGAACKSVPRPVGHVSRHGFYIGTSKSW